MLRSSTRVLSLLCLVMGAAMGDVAASVSGQDSPGVRQVVEDSIDTIMGGGALRYEVTVSSRGNVGIPVIPMQATVTLLPKTGGAPGRFQALRMEGTSGPADAPHATLRVTLENEVVESLDTENATLWRSPLYRGPQGMYEERLLYPFLSLETMQAALQENARILKQETLEGQVCNVVDYSLETGYGFRVWLGKEDRLVHRVDFGRVSGVETGRGN
jgi:hypothetical protein